MTAFSNPLDAIENQNSRRNTGYPSLISIIIIFYNAEKFIREAIESVFTQTYANWELVLVDDGSNDKSSEIAQEYVRQFPDKVRCLAHEGKINCGMSASRNLGIQFSRGAYISFLDADDVWRSNTLQDQIAILEAHSEAALVYGELQYWYSWTGDPADQNRDTIEHLGVPPDTLIQPPELLHLFLRGRAAVPSGILVRREAIERFGSFENTFRGEYEDQVFCAKMCLNAPVFASSKCWYRYRQHPDSCVSVGQKMGSALSARQVYLRWLKKYLSEQGVKNWKVWWALRQEYWLTKHPRLFHFYLNNRYNLERLFALRG